MVFSFFNAHEFSYEEFINCSYYIVWMFHKLLVEGLVLEKRDAIWKRISTQCGLTFAYYKNLQWQKKESYHPYFASKTYKSEYFILILHTKQYLFAFFPALLASYLCLQIIRMSSLLASQLCTKKWAFTEWLLLHIYHSEKYMKDKNV